MKYTPGPWKIAGYAGQHDESGASIRSEDGRQICNTWGALREASPQSEWNRYHADAQLIAAAPELLEACEAVPRILYGLGLSDPRQGMVAQTAIDKCRQAIKSAKGETE